MSISPRLEVFVGDEKITDCSAALSNPGPATYERCFDEVELKLGQNPKLQEDKTLYLLADADIRYGFVVGVMNRIRKAGVTNFGMVTNPGYGADDAPPAPQPGKP
jgi:biopolymer transport protein TolR